MIHSLYGVAHDEAGGLFANSRTFFDYSNGPLVRTKLNQSISRQKCILSYNSGVFATDFPIFKSYFGLISRATKITKL